MASRCADGTVTGDFHDELPNFQIDTFSEFEEHSGRFAEKKSCVLCRNFISIYKINRTSQGRLGIRILSSRAESNSQIYTFRIKLVSPSGHVISSIYDIFKRGLYHNSFRKVQWFLTILATYDKKRGNSLAFYSVFIGTLWSEEILQMDPSRRGLYLLWLYIKYYFLINFFQDVTEGVSNSKKYLKFRLVLFNLRQTMRILPPARALRFPKDSISERLGTLRLYR